MAELCLLEADSGTLIKSSKRNKRKRNAPDDQQPDAAVAIPPDIQHLRRLVLSLSKPSFNLIVGSTRPRAEHRARLHKLLRKLVIHQNWIEASGVLSVLLKAGYKDRSPVNNRLKYSVLMVILERLGGEFTKSNKIESIYSLWLNRIGFMKGQSDEYRFAVQLERSLFYLTQGNLDGAYNNALSLKNLNEFTSEPLLMMSVGLTYQHLWLSNIPEELQWRELDQFYTARKSSEQTVHSEEHYAVNSHEAGTAFQCDSETSVMNDKALCIDAGGGLYRENYVGVDYMEIENYQPKYDNQNFYADDAENTENEASLANEGGRMHYAPIFTDLVGLESLLLPIRLPDNTEDFMNTHKQIFSNYFEEAVKYLRGALHSTPPVLVALHPLIQLLLIGGQVKEALNEVEFCCNSNAALPIRLRALLLEHFDRDNSALHSTCFEDALKKDPTCRDSLEKLVCLHQNDEYSSESLLEMIALHLDATYADYETWKEFASCFLRVSSAGEDQMSVCLNGNEGGDKQQYTFKKTPKMFIEGNSGESWRVRCRWWRTRHFSLNMLASEIEAGDLQLITYKTACAVHMYGSEFDYVVDASHMLEKQDDSSLLMILRTHVQRSAQIASNFQRTTR